MAEIKYEIHKHLGVLNVNSRGWKKEINIISWNERKPKIDIREWDENHEKMSKGITLTADEVRELKKILEDMDEESLEV